jgi:radical SAM superfamily enzyme YgiQ (UPF0313 family)
MSSVDVVFHLAASVGNIRSLEDPIFDHWAVHLAQALLDGSAKENLRHLDGLGSREFYNPPVGMISDLDSLPFPAWALFPLENYWNLRFAHGPQTTERYLPLLTSRGCPYPCKFCVAPTTRCC